MLLGTVIGYATATIKHPSMKGWKLSIVQPINSERQPEADPVIAADSLGASPGQTVILNSDGKAARDLIGHDKSPVRYFVIALADE
ncbi:EutN/CcmL family microcompartment protein [Humisphaera borealis]|uniref:EutN/CcmL family microcompartment protein n=1 Tax=Humisphaera borealis TaxID=2807512 RepID=A0A7M2WX89_9BACT|nr:EutN/CcmL family microcompartment protein [Humisphaera borealis]QOV90019.1 EutN/CcmL family microcompartment protein [Humisphaera borealis]